LKITIIGSGYVGLTTGTAFAYLGHKVTLLDIDKNKIDKLRKGISPIYENGLDTLLNEVKDNITFIDSWEFFKPDAEIIIIAVGTPSKTNGDADLTYVERVAVELGNRIEDNSELVVVNKSTVPIGSASRVKTIINNILEERKVNATIHVASNPEFLREGEALFDTFYPDRVIIGVDSETAKNKLHSLYQPILEQTFIPPKNIERPVGYSLPALITTNPTSAELIKYAANSFLAMKISFINEFANLAEKVGADITQVARGIGLDTRIGTRFLNAGIGWGGSCFGKDTKAILYTAKQYNSDMKLVEATIEANYKQREVVIKKLQSILKVIRGKTIGILGLSFKPNTDDLRDAPSLDIIRKLLSLDAIVKVYDPIAMDNCKQQHPELDIKYEENAEDVFINSDAVVLVTEWDEFKRLPFIELGEKMNHKVIIDGRNALNPDIFVKNGFIYSGIGRG
jgi:UDPglucose 6-dehydrogenase